MVSLVWLGLAHAAETDCVTKDLTWRWLSQTADAPGGKSGDRWVHGTTKLVEQGAAAGRLSWKADEASKVPFRTSRQDGATIETFKWTVTLTATDSKPIAADVKETEVKLTMHCQRTTGGAAPAAPKAAPAPAPAAPKAAPAPAPAAPKAAPAPAPAAPKAAPAPAPAAPAPKP